MQCILNLLRNKWKIVKIRRLFFSSHINLTWLDKNLDINVSLWLNEIIVFYSLWYWHIINYVLHFSLRRFYTFVKYTFQYTLFLHCEKKHNRGHSTTTWTEFCHFLTPPPCMAQIIGRLFSPSQKVKKLSHPFRLCFELSLGVHVHHAKY